MSVEQQMLMLRLGQSKMEKLQSEFVMTHKDTGKEIIRKHGTEAFTMWWYIEGLCFGKSKVTAFPKIETIAKDLGVKTNRTIQRWLKKLEDIKAIKRVSLYNVSGSQTSNLLIMNASFPDIPEGWDELYQYGAYQMKHMEYIPLENAEDKPWTNMSGAINPHIPNLHVRKNKKNSPRQICQGLEITHDKYVREGAKYLSGGVQGSNLVVSTDKDSFFVREEEKINKKISIQEDANKSEFIFYNWLEKNG